MTIKPALWSSLSPFGAGATKPHHYRDMARIVWENRRELPFAWKILTKGTCDGCALGTRGLSDWTIEGTHLCMVRLEMMRLNTMPALDPGGLSDVSKLGALSSRELRELGRLPCPMARRKGERGFREISWEEAFEISAEKIRACDPRRLAFYLTSRGILNEHYYAAQKAARFLGTNHIDNSARLCHAASTTAMKRALGHGATTCSYTDWLGTDLIVFFGSNAANNQPVAMKYLYEARNSGTKVALVNPLDEPGMERYWVPSSPESAVFGTKMCDAWFPVDTGGDLAFLLGVFKILVGEGWIESDFISRATSGFAEARSAADRHAFDELEVASGAARGDMRRFAEMLRDARNAVFVWSMGLTQHRHGTATVTALVNIALARHYVGREKNGLMPIRGHSGVQGGAEVGCTPALDPEQRKRFEDAWGFPLPENPGYTATEQVAAAARGEIDVFWIVGGNFLETLPDPAHARAALEGAGTRIHQDIVVTTQMFAEPKDTVLLFPATTRYESPGGGTETSTERRIIFSPEIPGRRVGSARAEWDAFSEVACRARPARADLLRIKSSRQLREEIGKTIPLYAGIERLRSFGESFQWGGPRLFSDDRFATPDGKARFAPAALPAAAPPGLLRLSTRRGKQFNSMIQRETDPLNGARRDDLLISQADASSLRIEDGERVIVESEFGRMSAVARVSLIKPGNVQVHWPEGLPLLCAETIDPDSREPDYNASVRIRTMSDSKELIS